MKKYLLIFIMFLSVGYGSGARIVSAQTQDSNSVLYVPLIGITSVPKPFALPKGPGEVTYQYAVKNFLREAALTDVRVVDDNCSPVTFVEGDDNGDKKLDYSETWRYRCTTTLTTTKQGTATATGVANDITTTDSAYATVVVGSENPPPLVSIVNITKVAYPLSLPAQGGPITFTYRVNNPGIVPLSKVTITDDKCGAMSSKLGDTNGNNLLDIHEVWIYTCTATLKTTTTNTATVTAFANGLKAVDTFTLTVKVAPAFNQIAATLPDTALPSGIKTMVWAVLAGILMVLILIHALARNGKSKKNQQKPKFPLLIIAILLVSSAGIGTYALLPLRTPEIKPDNLFGWKYGVANFPEAGPTGDQLAYSDIRDPGGIPEGLPVRLRIPVISVNSAIEDALITPDGRMDVPAGSVNVAWFALGPHPGQEGSAVIGGHFGITKGVPFVFYNLDKVKVGDMVYVEDDNDKTLAFVVRKIKSFDRNADATTVFTSGDGLAHLNLITCEGTWNRINDSYPQRLVVFTDAVAGYTGSTVRPSFPATASTTPDQKVASPTTPKPEATTNTPLVTTQPPNPETPTTDTVATPPPIEESATPEVPTAAASVAPHALVKATLSLYASWTDALITSWLLISLVLMSYIMIRRRI